LQVSVRPGDKDVSGDICRLADGTTIGLCGSQTNRYGDLGRDREWPRAAEKS
jgi:hypothetical protein